MGGYTLVTGGAGFIGSHAAEYFAGKGQDVVVLDNLSRAELLGKSDKNASYNWNYLKKIKGVKLIKGDARDSSLVEKLAKDASVILHAAAQTAVTTSVVNPAPDFSVNATGTFTVLEAARKSRRKPTVVYCSTNKVYGHNVNDINVKELKTRYAFNEKKIRGITETFSIDLCEHTPYGCSKLTGDLYVQDYAYQYGIRTGVFRMSCIYGTRQFGVEDQGWVAWFSIATLKGSPITIYGDGKQVRDVLFVTDVVKAYDAFIESSIPHAVFNTGGGPENTMSLIELLGILEKETGMRSKISYSDWRPSDQKVYISDITKIKKTLKWKPAISPEEGVKRIISWVKGNISVF